MKLIMLECQGFTRKKSSEYLGLLMRLLKSTRYISSY